MPKKNKKRNEIKNKYFNRQRIRKLRTGKIYKEKKCEASNIKIDDFEKQIEIKIKEYTANTEEEKKKKEVQRIRRIRQNSTYKEIERERNRQRMRHIRQNPLYKKSERESNIERMKQTRQDPSYKEKERDMNIKRIRSVREEQLYRELEKEKNIKQIKLKRKVEIYCINEQIKNKERIRFLRTNSEYKLLNNELNNIIKKRKFLEDSNFVKKQRGQDIERKRLLRLDDFFKYREKYNNYVQMKTKNENKDNEYYYYSLHRTTKKIHERFL